MPGVLLQGWDDTNKKWIPVLVNASGKLELASLEDAEISQATPEDMKHVPHGRVAGDGVYLPFAVDANGKLQIAIAALEHLNDIADVSVASPTDGHVLYWDNATSLWKAKAVLSNVVEDTTPQLGGDLDCQDKKLTSLLGNLFKTATELTIATGVITVTQALHTVDTEGDAASDDLATINGGATVNMIVIKAANDARTVVVKHNTGNIWLQGKADISLDDLEDGLLLIWSGTKWFDIAAGGAAVGGYTEGARVYHSAAQTIPTTTETTLAFDSELYDTDSIHDNVTNNSRLTCKTAGKYMIGALLQWDTHATGRRYAKIMLNATSFYTFHEIPPTSGTYPSHCIFMIMELAVNDYIEATVYQSSGGNLDILQAAHATPEFMMQRVG